MCLIIYKPENVPFNRKHITNAHVFNSDGIGLSVLKDDGKVRVYRGLTLDQFMLIEPTLTEYRTVLHLRYGTSGDATWEQCHPMRMGRATRYQDYVVREGEKILFHNGVMFSRPGQYSDTQLVARGLMAADYRAALEKYLGGNRFLVQDSDGSIELLGKWHSVEGMSYSNLSYHEEYSYDTHLAVAAGSGNHDWAWADDMAALDDHACERCGSFDIDAYYPWTNDRTIVQIECFECDASYPLSLVGDEDILRSWAEVDEMADDDEKLGA